MNAKKKYKGKYPNRIRLVWSFEGSIRVTTNDDTTYKVGKVGPTNYLLQVGMDVIVSYAGTPEVRISVPLTRLTQ